MCIYLLVDDASMMLCICQIHDDEWWQGMLGVNQDFMKEGSKGEKFGHVYEWMCVEVMLKLVAKAMGVENDCEKSHVNDDS